MAGDAQWPTIRAVVERALARPPAERAAFVAAACRDDEALHRQVELMLESVDESFIELDETRALDMQAVAAAADPLIGRSLAHYRITDKVGQGGMGAVYRAWDDKLGREVAIKVLPAEFAEDPRRLERFEREARMLASVNHPNIATIHDVDESHGVHYLVLEMVEGEGLDRRIARAPLAFDEAVPVFIQIADALEAAHEKGIIHRDLKPANVHVTPRGQVKVLDFGLAKALEALPVGPASTGAAQRSAPRQTRAGAIVGTVTYMSPEQARGKPVDKRTDFWSFGCTLYEALAGRPPFRGDSLFETVAAIIEREPDWAALPADTPARTRRLLERCLDKDPERRVAAAADVRAALAPRERRTWRPWLVMSALVLVLLGLGLWRVWRDRAAVSVTATPKVAVTGVTNLSGRSQLDWLEEGLASLVRDRLAESRHVAVVSRSRWETIARSAGDSRDLSRLAARSGIDFVVSGELLSTPAGLVWTARVTDAAAGVDLVARRIEGLTETSLLDSSNRVALLAKQAMKIPHTETVEVFAADFAAEHPGAYESYLAGLEFFGDFAYDDAERSFRSALELEPGYHVARYRLAHVLWLTGRTEQAQATLAAIPNDAELTPRERLYIEGARALLERDWTAAKQAYRSLLEQYPYELEAREFLAEVHDMEYDDEAALEQLRILAEQEPENPAVWANLGQTHLRVGAFDEAEAALDTYLALAPAEPLGFTVLGELNRARRRFDVAVRHFEHALELSPGFPPAMLGLATTSALAGDRARAEELWQRLVDDETEQPGYRIDAAFELSALRRAAGRFEQSLEPLARLAPLIEREGFREALALSTEGLIRVELGQLDAAGERIALAIERSPSVPTRYLFARGWLELARGDADAVRATAEEIRGHTLPPADPDRTEDKAAAFLDGMAALAAGDAARAVEATRRAVALEGHAYASYELGLARALRAADRHEEAVKLAAAAAAAPDPVEPRLDLELDRVRALLVEAEIRDEMNDRSAARRLARAFLERFAAAPGDHPDVVRARALARKG
ncbi:MAG TPA: protein kinase [Candidatus Polarisedimenticolaceae bacterium]|nr:protein kinase [Candidatus Polarisedimenticolaceae bacterium]